MKLIVTSSAAETSMHSDKFSCTAQRSATSNVVRLRDARTPGISKTELVPAPSARVKCNLGISSTVWYTPGLCQKNGRKMRTQQYHTTPSSLVSTARPDQCWVRKSKSNHLAWSVGPVQMPLLLFIGTTPLNLGSEIRVTSWKSCWKVLFSHIYYYAMVIVIATKGLWCSTLPRHFRITCKRIGYKWQCEKHYGARESETHTALWSLARTPGQARSHLTRARSESCKCRAVSSFQSSLVVLTAIYKEFLTLSAFLDNPLTWRFPLWYL